MRRETEQVTEQVAERAASLLDKVIEYTPQGEREPIRLNGSLVMRYLVTPTKSGAKPSEQDVVRFLMLCKARELNPYVGDAYLVGYDGKDGPVFSLITGVQAMHKRADRCPEYDGLAAGIIVDVNGEVREINGTVKPANATLIGGWARARRKDRSEPYYYSVQI